MENERRSVDYLVIGQGLAGSAVAMQLVKRNKTVVVIDDRARNAASRVAAGLFNPITGGRHLVKTWMADEIFPFLQEYYSWVSGVVTEKFFFPMDLYRPFASVEEQNEWMGKSADPYYADYVKKVVTVPGYETGVNDPFGGIVLKQCGYLDTITYLEAVRRYLSPMRFIEESFNDEALILNEGDVEYGDIRASRVIFCQGVSGMESKWFRGLPIRPLKGETLTIKSHWQKDLIVNRGVYMVPGGAPGEYRVGSTYRTQDLSHASTDEGREELEEKLRQLVSFPFQVVRQDWGFRPATSDRKPILGCSVLSDRLVIFNGLGTKGVSLAPYFSDVLIRWLENNAPLNKQVAATRYK